MPCVSADTTSPSCRSTSRPRPRSRNRPMFRFSTERLAHLRHRCSFLRNSEYGVRPVVRWPCFGWPHIFRDPRQPEDWKISPFPAVGLDDAWRRAARRLSVAETLDPDTPSDIMCSSNALLSGRPPPERRRRPSSAASGRTVWTDAWIPCCGRFLHTLGRTPVRSTASLKSRVLCGAHTGRSHSIRLACARPPRHRSGAYDHAAPAKSPPGIAFFAAVGRRGL
jgi:hypothetical protein